MQKTNFGATKNAKVELSHSEAGLIQITQVMSQPQKHKVNLLNAWLEAAKKKKLYLNTNVQPLEISTCKDE